MNSFEYYSPTKVIFGKDGEIQAGSEIKLWGGSRVLILSGGKSARESGLLDRVEASVRAAGLYSVHMDGVRPNPRLSFVNDAIVNVRREKLDFILAVGGGSVIDTAKAIAVGADYDGDVWDFYAKKAVPQKALPTANILTIAAAGSETSATSVITKEECKLKASCKNNVMRPRFAILNPELTCTLPAYQTASGVVDIIMHTMERYFSQTISETTEAIAEAIMKTVILYGKKAVEEPRNYEARSEMMWLGSVSHNDLTGLGKVPDWTTHMMDEQLSGLYDVTHGAGLSALWGSWARAVYPAGIWRFVRFAANVWGIRNLDDDRKTALAGIQKTEEFFSSLGMPTNIEDLMGRVLSDDEIEVMADNLTKTGANKAGKFKPLAKNEIIEIYKAARESK